MDSSPRCYVCKEGQYAFLFSKHQHRLVQCSSCGLVALEMHGDYDEFLHKYYDKGYFSGQDNKFGYADYASEEQMLRRNARHYLRYVTRYIKEGRLLDAGCAGGFFMDEAEKVGFASSGFDVSEYVVQFAPQNLKERIQVGALHSLEYERGQFDVVTMFDIIEHLYDPIADLQKVGTWLGANGLVVIGTGDIGSLYTRLLGKHSHFFAPPHHIYYFSRETITLMLDKAGFEVLDISSMGKWLTLAYIARVSRHLELSFVERILNSRLFSNLLGKLYIYLYFGDTMIVTGRKKS